MDPDVTRLLHEAGAGDPRATEALLVVLYQELRTLARQKMAHERPGQTLQATALVHEAYLRLVGGEAGAGWANRAHFFRAAAETMRRILIDRAREKGSLKRGGDHRRLSLDPATLLVDDVPPALLSLDEALRALEQTHPVHAELVKLRFFAGLTLRDAAKTLELPPTTADRHWAFARVWLHRRIAEEDGAAG